MPSSKKMLYQIPDAAGSLGERRPSSAMTRLTHDSRKPENRSSKSSSTICNHPRGTASAPLPDISPRRTLIYIQGAWTVSPATLAQWANLEYVVTPCLTPPAVPSFCLFSFHCAVSPQARWFVCLLTLCLGLAYFVGETSRLSPSNLEVSLAMICESTLRRD